MFEDQKLVVVMPAYNAAKTFRITCEEVMAQCLVDLVILVDDASHDETVAIVRTMNQLKVHIHEQNLKAYLFILVMVFFDARSNQ
jgi:glycosyltransferase involved in cell wall biosynthesis